jgi:1,5-anhydro-D-fructose reductase (1,5-anhydro-D-mannitol-forming)
MKPSVAFIGLGVMGQRMLSNMKIFGGFDIAAGWDPSKQACEQAVGIVPDLPIADTPQDIIEGSATDLVYIACPPAHHKEYAMLAIDAGKAVFCEKPLGIDISESKTLVSAIEAAGNKHCVNFSLASAAAVEFIEKGLADGSIGDVQGVDIQLHFSKWPRDWQVPAAWLSERAEGGFVRETFSHYAYLTERLFGPAKIQNAYTRYPNDCISAEIQSMAALDCGGIPITFWGGVGGINSSGADRVEFTIWGSNAVYRLYDWNRIRTSTGSGWTEQLNEISDLRQEGYRRSLDNLGKLMRGEHHSLPTFRDALSVQEIVEGILTN